MHLLEQIAEIKVFDTECPRRLAVTVIGGLACWLMILCDSYPFRRALTNRLRPIY